MLRGGSSKSVISGRVIIGVAPSRVLIYIFTYNLLT